MQCPYELPAAAGSTRLNPVIEKRELALLMLLGLAGFSVLVGLGYQAIRRYVYKDGHKFDVIFDAGGRVSLSLTTVTSLSQLFWPVDFLQSSTIASKVGIAGSLWYTMAIVVSILTFAVLSYKLKARAPGAKTFPQVAYARFGRGAHLMFCGVALFTNLVVTSYVILAGKAVVEVLSKDSSNEFVCLLMAVLFGSYCLIGGLGTTFYISYFSTSLIFLATTYFILKTTHFATPEVRNVTSMSVMYEAMSCLKGPGGNYQNSLLTYRSESGLMFGLVLLVMTMAIAFCDQANWQSKIAAKPLQGTVGFVLTAFLWVGVPTSISYTSTMIYMTMSYQNGTNLLTSEEIDAGYITPYVVQALLGREGCFVLLAILTMSLMSTGSGEVMSISSVLVYDVIKTYVKPFRAYVRPTDCLLCGRTKLPYEEDQCDCPTAIDCTACAADIESKLAGNMTPDFRYTCLIHGKYRHYEDELGRLKSWCMAWVVVAIVPVGLLVIETGMNLNWAFFVCQVLLEPFLVPLFLTIGWSRATGQGLIAGGLLGLLSGVVGMLVFGSTYEGGLSDFYTNTAQDGSILVGLLAGFIVSTVVSVGVSLACSVPRQGMRTSSSRASYNKGGDASVHGLKSECLENKLDKEENEIGVNTEELEWQKTLSLDNPLNPFRLIYKKELQHIGAMHQRSLKIDQMETIFRRPKIISGIVAGFGFLVFLVVIPCLALSEAVLTEAQLEGWVSVCQHWVFIGTVLVVIVPPVQEVCQIRRQVYASRNRKNDDRTADAEREEILHQI